MNIGGRVGGWNRQAGAVHNAGHLTVSVLLTDVSRTPGRDVSSEKKEKLSI